MRLVVTVIRVRCGLQTHRDARLSHLSRRSHGAFCSLQFTENRNDWSRGLVPTNRFIPNVHRMSQEASYLLANQREEAGTCLMTGEKKTTLRRTT